MVNDLMRLYGVEYVFEQMRIEFRFDGRQFHRFALFGQPSVFSFYPLFLRPGAVQRLLQIKQRESQYQNSSAAQNNIYGCKGIIHLVIVKPFKDR